MVHKWKSKWNKRRNRSTEHYGKFSLGYEYWSRRPFSCNGGAWPCKITKIETHKYERRVIKKKIIKIELEFDLINP